MHRVVRGIAFVGVLLAAGSASAATKTWVGGSSSYNTAGNWSPSGVPGTSDDVILTMTNNTAMLVDADVAVASFTVQTGHTAAITQSGTRNMDMTGDFTITGNSNITAPAGRLSIGGKFSKTGSGTFTHNSGTVLLRSTSNQTHDFASAAFSNLVINDGLLAYWKFDEGGTFATASDSSGYGWTLTGVNTPSANATGIATLFYNGGGGVTLAKASTEYLHTGVYTTLLQPASGWTISAWIQLVSTDTSGSTIFTADNDYLLTVLPVSGGVSKIRATERYGAASWTDCDSTATIANPTGATWHHAVGVYDGSHLYVWVDGVKKDCGATGGAQTFSTPADTIVGGRASGAYKYDGSIDELRVYGRALTDTEIIALYSGSQPGSYVSTQKPSGTFSVANDFTIASGNWDDNGQSFTVTGSFYNWGGLMTATGTLTMNTAGTEYIIGNRQNFNTLTVSGAGTVTIRDSLYVAGTVNLSSGTLLHEANDSRYKGHFGNFNQTGGTYNQNSLGGSNLYTSTASNTLKVTSTTSQFRLEAKGETGLVGYWKLDEQTGSTAFDISQTGNTGTLVNGVRWWNSKYNNGGTTSVISSPIGFFHDGGWVDLDGTDDYITLGTTSIPVPNASQSISLWVYYDATTAAQQNFYSLVDATAAHNVQVGFHSSNIAVWKSGATDLVTYAIPAISTWHPVVYTYDSTTATHKLYVDGTLQDTETGIAADTAGSAPYYATIGAYRANGGTYGQFYDGRIDDVRVYNVVLTAKQVKAMSQDKFPGLGSSVTWTLGANMSTGSFAMDNGTLDTGAFTVTTSGNCYVPSGTLKISVGGAATCGNDPVIYDTGTLNLAGGTLNVADGKIIQMDGTLQAATTSGTTPTIQVSSGGTSYAFHVGQANGSDSTTPTPTIDINGLNVKNGDADGMFINFNTSSTTTFTRFDGVSFSSGLTTSGSTLMRIYGASQYVTGNGCTFNRNGMHNTSYNVKIAGNGTADGETRAIFGNTTCKNTAGSAETCESNDNDNDSTNDGVGDTSATDAGVVQFVNQAWDESQGSIAGFPTPAFNWSTFAYWRTYAAFNNDDGAGTNTLYGRDDANSPYTSYTWSIPAGNGTFVGVPRWDMESSTHYVYVVTSLGYVYKLSDSGSAFAVVAGYPYHNTTGGSAATATSGLVMDSTSVYWAGLDGAATRKMFRVTRSSGALSGTPRAISADINGGLAIAPWSGSNYLFGATNVISGNGKVYKLSLDLATEYGSMSGQQSTTNISSRLTVYGGYVYFAEDNGKIWAIDTTDNLATLWSYQDTGNGHGACSSSSDCTVKALYLEPASKRVYYGDQDGHVHIVSRSGVTANGALYSGYPSRPTGAATTDPFVTAPVYVSGLGGASAGVIAIGSSTGKVFFIDQQNASAASALIRMYHAGSAIASLAFRRTSSSAGVFQVSTANGHTYYIDSADVADPTPNNN
jgi:hypothetical protein